MQKPRLLGADYSVYVRSARLAFTEKRVAYELDAIDVFAADGPPASYLKKHPFGRIPALEHGDFTLYETGAITRYVDEAFEGPALQPVNIRSRARMNQIISIADGYIYPTLVWGIYVEQVSKPRSGKQRDFSRLQTALDKAPICLQAMEDLMTDGPWAGGSDLSLADLHLAPMMDYFMKAPVAPGLMSGVPALASWWNRISSRASMRATIPTS